MAVARQAAHPCTGHSRWCTCVQYSPTVTTDGRVYARQRQSRVPYMCMYRSLRVSAVMSYVVLSGLRRDCSIITLFHVLSRWARSLRAGGALGREVPLSSMQ
jgi:hypothetical protein